MKRLIVTLGIRRLDWAEKESLNIPHKTQFWNCSRDSVEVHCFVGKVWVVAALDGCLALPFAALVLPTLGDLTAVLLILASDVKLAFDVCLQKVISLSGGKFDFSMANNSHLVLCPQARALEQQVPSQISQSHGA